MSKAGAILREKSKRPQGGGLQPRPEVLRAAEGMIAAQKRPGEMARLLSETFHLSERQCQRYIASVNVRLVAESEETRPLRKHALRASLQAVYQRAMTLKQLGAAVQALDRLAKLDGLYEATRIEGSGTMLGCVLVVPPEED